MGFQTIIIAEAGVNHNGDMDRAMQMIDVAAEAGADYVKFQTFNADRLVTREAQKAGYQLEATGLEESQHQMLKKLEVSEDIHHLLLAHCQKREIGFLSSGFDIESIDLLRVLGLNFYKIPSGEITNLPYLRHIGSFGGDIALSTGMCLLGDVEAAIAVLEQAGTSRDRITVLHCTTEYPTQMPEVNLRAMQNMGAALGVRIGYSDHTPGIEVAIAAVAMGACVIEKHFTLDRLLPGPDHMASLEPAELKAMISGIRNIELALGDGIKRLTLSEARNRPIVRKSLVAACPIRKGDVFSAKNMTAKRPGIGISPMRWEDVLGRVAERNFAVDELIVL